MKREIWTWEERRGEVRGVPVGIEIDGYLPAETATAVLEAVAAADPHGLRGEVEDEGSRVLAAGYALEAVAVDEDGEESIEVTDRIAVARWTTDEFGDPVVVTGSEHVTEWGEPVTE